LAWGKGDSFVLPVIDQYDKRATMVLIQTIAPTQAGSNTRPIGKGRSAVVSLACEFMVPAPIFDSNLRNSRSRFGRAPEKNRK
jgi:hypothetical protein